MRFFTLLALSLAFSCSHKVPTSGKATIIKQWHASPSLNTTNISASKNAPQYKNQKDIYLYLEKNLPVTLIVEGCESGKVIDELFAPQFNGWSMASLKEAAPSSDYADIITAIPMKLKAKFPKDVTALCADSEELIRKNQLAVSDARGFAGFYLRLKQNVSRPTNFAAYKKSLEETQKMKIADPLAYSKEKAIKAVEDFNHYIQLRNTSFAQAIKKNINRNPILVVGGLHADDLVKQLQAEGIKTEVITPQGYPEENEKLGTDLMKLLSH